MNDGIGILLHCRISTLLNGVLEGTNLHRCNVLIQDLLDVVPDDAFELSLNRRTVGVTVNL